MLRCERCQVPEGRPEDATVPAIVIDLAYGMHAFVCLRCIRDWKMFEQQRSFFHKMKWAESQHSLVCMTATHPDSKSDKTAKDIEQYGNMLENFGFKMWFLAKLWLEAGKREWTQPEAAELEKKASDEAKKFLQKKAMPDGVEA